MFSKTATKIDEIFTVDLTLCSKCQIDGEDFFNFCGLLRKHELYQVQIRNTTEHLNKWKFSGIYVNIFLRDINFKKILLR